MKTIENRIEIRDITGFYGFEEYSTNRIYCVYSCDGYSENNRWIKGNLALLRNKELLFKKKLERPHDCHVSNNGIVVCCDWLNTEALAGRFLIYNSIGEEIFSKRTIANLGASAVSDDGQIAIFETYNSETRDANSVFIIDIENKGVINQFEKVKAFNSAEINTNDKLIKLVDHRNFVFEIDYEGNQTNKEGYENQIMSRGSIYDRLCLYSDKPNELKFNNTDYLELLNAALSDMDASYSIGLATIYRLLGEYYNANKNILKVIENWEKAIQINPKIGIKKKLDSLKKKLDK